MNSIRIASLVLIALLAAACGGGGGGSSGSSQPPPTPNSTSATVLAANDLGMHCMDREFSVFSILPPFNVVNAQVVARDSNGDPVLLDDADTEVRYDAVADPSGSIDTYSVGKTDFWQYANDLFGVSLTGGEGLTRLYMPEDNPQSKGPQPMEYTTVHEWFWAHGIPVTPVDDASNTNTYPLMRITAYSKTTGNAIGHLDVVVPVATETDCQTCHKTGAIAAQGAGPGAGWATDADLEVQAKKNILKLHDQNHSTNLEASQPVLCAGCHYSPALDLAGTGPTGDQLNNPTFSNVMHEFHGQLSVFQSATTVDESCYQCHPGKITQCQRGAMKTGGMDCFDCHGDMLAVGGTTNLQAGGSIDGTNDGKPRRPWQDLPRCQACHTGDAVSYLNSDPSLVHDPNWPFRLRQTYKTGDASASPLLAGNIRFAENANTLFRFSKGHGGIACEGCHGSTHAIWPAGTNDNLAAAALQGHTGKIIECTTCHTAGSLQRTTDGPHGLHNVADARWYDDGHGDFYENNKNNCKACHGLDLTGTPLAQTAAARNFRVEDGTIAYVKGALVRCDRCHGMPSL
jgi:cytochrome c5